MPEGHDLDIKKNVQFGVHDSEMLTGDYYAPQGTGPYPALVAVHGGGWQLGTAEGYQYWGPYLAQRGYVLSWLRVFRRANTDHCGHNGGQEREPRVVPLEKYMARRGSVEDGIRMIAACFAHVPQRCASHIDMHFILTFQEII